MHGHDRDIRNRHHGKPYQLPVDLFRLNLPSNVAKEPFSILRPGLVIKPAPGRGVVVRPRVDHAILREGVGQIDVHGIVFSEGKKENLHAREAKTIDRLPDIGGDHAQILRDDWQAEIALEKGVEKIVDRHPHPLAVDGILLVGRHLPEGYETAKMIDPHHVVKGEDVREPVGRLGWPKDKGRDGERTPMQWDTSKNAGFSTASATWLPVAPNYTSRNVGGEGKDSTSLLNYYKALIRLRKSNAAIGDGDFALVNEDDQNVLAFVRKKNGVTVLVALNLSAVPRTASFEGAQATTLLSSFSKAGQSVSLKNLALPAYGAFVGQVR